MAAEDKGKQKAGEEAAAGSPKEEAPKVPEDELRAEARRAARDRLNGWMRLRLAALMLLEAVLTEAEGGFAGPRNGAAASSSAQQRSLESVQEDLRQVGLMTFSAGCAEGA